MPHCTRTKEDVAGRVADMFRIAEARDDLDLQHICLLSGMTYETLLSYRNGTAMPLHAFVQIAPKPKSPTTAVLTTLRATAVSMA